MTSLPRKLRYLAITDEMMYLPRPVPGPLNFGGRGGIPSYNFAPTMEKMPGFTPMVKAVEIAVERALESSGSRAMAPIDARAMTYVERGRQPSGGALIPDAPLPPPPMEEEVAVPVKS